jgi:hypothetical protein
VPKQRSTKPRLPKVRLAETPSVIVSWSPLGGRGVFAARDMKKGELVERCPYLRMHEDDASGLLNDYVFEDGDQTVVLPLGYGGLYNHAHPGNLEHYDDEDDECFEYYTSRPVWAGEELCLDYGESWWETREFEPEEY